MDTKKQWQKPQLVILGRGTEEEKVLFACKYPGSDGPTGSGGNGNNRGCSTNSTPCTIRAAS